ncbi:hypothetical protein EHS17_02095 [Rhodobacteraceae bacterium CH30]|nr:hypothetical protein EHS17_02095 [Rhodobacteraceae bacterium CH30]
MLDWKSWWAVAGRECRRVLKWVVLAWAIAPFFSLAMAGSDGDYSGRRIGAVQVVFDGGQKENAAYRDAVLKAFGAFSGDLYDPSRSDLMLNQVRRLAFVKDASYQARLGGNGSLELVVDVALSDVARPLDEVPIGVLRGRGWQDFPTLYADDRSALLAKLENKTMVFSNTHAFFGRPDVLTVGNPLAQAPSGSDGTDTWLESSVEAGLYGLSALSDRISVFGGASYIVSGSWGPELFTDETRAHGGVEDAYLGFVGRDTTDQGGLRVFSLLYGRKPFQVDNGMILRLASANGGERAALQSNPRDAANPLAHAMFVYDRHKLEFFRLDPDELEELDTGTVINGVNYEGRVLPELRLGAMWLQVPKSRAAYFTPDTVYSRKGLRVADLRAAYEPAPGQSSLYARAEIAHQSNENFDMDAWGGYAEAGWQFRDIAWRPTLSYRYSKFTGDKPDTKTFERWDPLYAGGAGDEWVQGLNQYKVVQTSNVIAHRFMARLNPSPRWELTPQFWLFKADTLNNLGGARALSQLESYDLAKEINLTARYVANPKLIFVMSAAYTIPGTAIRRALNGDYQNWFSASALMIARF